MRQKNAKKGNKAIFIIKNLLKPLKITSILLLYVFFLKIPFHRLEAFAPDSIGEELSAMGETAVLA